MMTQRWRTCGALTTALLLTTICPSAHGGDAVTEDIALAEGGQPTACIVIGVAATVTERFAAEELQRYVTEMTRLEDFGKGITLPILTDDAAGQDCACEILIGRPGTNKKVAKLCQENHVPLDAATLGLDGYVVRTIQPGNGRATLLLAGSHDRSALFAVYHFLETCGIRFFGYRERDGEIIPHARSLRTPPLHLVEKPAMRYRFVSDNGIEASNREKLVNVADWAVKNRHNAMMITPVSEGESWQQMPLEEFRKRGLMIVGPGHVLAKLTPKKELFAIHPEYFPLLGRGERRSTWSERWGGCAAFCFSNEEAMRLVVANAVRYVEENPFMDVFALYPPDGSQRSVQCKCAQCQTRSMSDWYLTLINHVSTALQSRRPGMKMLWIAYNECGVPPTHVQPADHGRQIDLLWCNDIRDWHEPMDSEANRKPARFLEWKPSLKRIKTDWKENPTDQDLAARFRWQRWSDYLRAGDYQGEVILLEYYNHHVSTSLRLPWMGHVQSGPWPGAVMPLDFQFYCREGIVGWQNCTEYYNDNPNPYWNRLIGQLLWNPSANVNAIDKDFYSRFYGPAGDLMRNYFTALWHEVALENATESTVKRVEVLADDLAAAEKIAEAAASPDLVKKVKAARLFHEHCIKAKSDLMEHYRPDGTPKDAR